MPGGSAGTSFCSGTEISISFRAMPPPPVRLFAVIKFVWLHRLDSGFGDDLAPFGNLVVDPLAHAVRAIGDDLETVVTQLGCDLGPLQYLDRFGHEQRDNGWRCLHRREKALERIGDEILV